MRPAYAGAIHAVLSAERRERREPAIYGDHRKAIFGDAVVWVAPNVPVHEAEQPQVWPPPCASLDAPHAIGSDLPGAQHQQEAPSAQDMALFAQECSDQPAKPGLVRRHHIYSNAAGLFISGGNPLAGRRLPSIAVRHGLA